MTDTPDVTSYSDPEHIASAQESGMTFESAMEAARNGHAVARKCWLREFRVIKIYYRDQPYLVQTGMVSPDYLCFYTSASDDRKAEDWKVVEHPVLWDKTDPRYRNIQP